MAALGYALVNELYQHFPVIEKNQYKNENNIAIIKMCIPHHILR